MGDLTRYELFKSGPPLGEVIDRNVVFGLSKIPGNGQTTVLAAGFILSALFLRVQNLPPVPNTIRYLAVVDEAHRVADFRAIQMMIREGRSKGLVSCAGDPAAPRLARRRCDQHPDQDLLWTSSTLPSQLWLHGDSTRTITRLPEQIRTLDVGEAYVSLGGDAPRLLRMTQAYRDHKALGLPPQRQSSA